MASNNKSPLTALVIGAIGVAYGDIGTSPLYALREVFAPGHVPLTHESVLGVLSLVFWTLTVVVSIKYIWLVLRADNNGEGGLIALMALATSAVRDRPVMRGGLLLLGMFGVALFYGDGVITPAVSVLSAVEGMQLAVPAMSHSVVPVTLVVLLALFLVQRNGSGEIGRYFGPVMVLWFVAIGVLGITQIIHKPEVLLALDPRYAIFFFLEHRWLGFLALSAVVLCVTGAESLYADLGHFGRRPIRMAWYCLVMPALLLNYFGQGALLLVSPDKSDNPFFRMAPDWALLPLVGLATAATVIASQALISGAFSATRQAIQMGFLPRARIVHTSLRDMGQIYVPSVNWTLFGGIVLAVLLFKSSGNLAAAYGIAVTMQMLITTIMTFFVVRFSWKYPLALCLLSTGFFLVVDLAYFSSNMLKVVDGGWFPLVVAGWMFTVMLTWRQGREALSKKRRERSIPLEPFLDSVLLNPPTRVPGTAVFMVTEANTVPVALLHNLKHNKVLHATNLFVLVQLHEVPWIGFEQRVKLTSLGHDCWQVVLNYGFKNEVNVPESLKLLKGRGIDLDDMQMSYFFSRDIVMPSRGGRGHMMAWREKLFATLYRNAEGAANFYSIPTNRVVELGAKVEI